MFDVDDVPFECTNTDGSTGFMSILFNFIDKNSDGCLTKKELKKAIKKIRNQCWIANMYVKHYIDYPSMNGQAPKVHNLNQHRLKSNNILKYNSPTFAYEFCVLWIDKITCSNSQLERNIYVILTFFTISLKSLQRLGAWSFKCFGIYRFQPSG